MRGERSKRTASKAGTRPRRVRLCGRRREGSGCGLGAGRATHGVLPPALRAPPLGGGRLRRGLSPNASPNASPKVSLFLTERHGTAVSFRVVLWLRIFEKHSKAGTRPRRARLCGRFVEMSLPRQPANLPTCKPANLPTCKPANLPTCKPANLPTCDPATPRTKKRAARIAKIRAAKTLAARYSPAADCRSTLATGALHFRVRNGNGCCVPAMATREKRRKTGEA